MCGIAGFYDANQSNLNEKILSMMLSQIDHRGPDSNGTWVDYEDGIYLGHARLAILELSPAGHQPMKSPCGRYVISFNGEIYNHNELRNQISSTISWKGASDTETLLQCIAHWGLSKTLEKTVGMFAFVLWDRHEKALYMARDRMGEKPLYYAWMDKTFMFGSELKALKKHPKFNVSTNWNAVNDYLHSNYISAPNTIYEDVFQLLPGCYAKINYDSLINRKRPAIFEYWSINEVAFKGQQNIFNGSFNEAEEKLDELLTKAVSLQSIADVEVGAFLSGGVDSSTIVALMKKNNRKVTTFSIGMPSNKYDESEYAEAVAKRLGTRHISYKITPDDALKIIERLPQIWDEPFADSSQIPTYLVSQFAKEHVTVVLSGDGGDELFLGYNQYPLLKSIWDMRILSKLPLSLLAKVANASGNVSMRGFSNKINNLATAWSKSDPCSLNEFWMDRYRNTENPYFGAVKNERERTKTLRLKSGISAIAVNDIRSYLCDDILTKVDRAAMAVSLETRAPFLDHRVVEFAMTLPDEYKMKGKDQKRVLKSLLFKHVDRHLIERPKQGFSLPMNEWLKKELKSWASNRLDFLPQDKFDSKIVQKIWKEHQIGLVDHSERIWGLCTLANYLESK